MRKKTIFSMAALALLLAGCSENEDAPQRPDLTGKPITVSPYVKNSGGIRAGHTENNLDKFLLFIDQEGDNDYSSVIMERKGGAWVPSNLPEGQMLLWQHCNPTANIVGYTLPDYTEVTYGTPVSDKVPITLPTDQTSDEAIKAADILQVAVNGLQPNDNGELNFEMQHFMSKIVINYSYGSEIPNGAEVLSCTMTEAGISWDLIDFTQDWTVNISGPTADVKMHLDPLNRTAEAIVMPKLYATYDEYKPTLIFRVRTDGEERDFSCKMYKPDEMLHFKGGCQYIMPVTIGRDKVTTGAITIKEWDKGNGDTGENLETEPANK